jgi:hypothetical protein
MYPENLFNIPKRPPPAALRGGVVRTVQGPKTSAKKQDRDLQRGKPPGILSLLGERWALLTLLAIMLLGAALRFYGLGFQSLWGEELASWDFSNRETLSQVIQVVRGGIHPPLHVLILRFAQWIFGDSQ